MTTYIVCDQVFKNLLKYDHFKDDQTILKYTRNSKKVWPEIASLWSMTIIFDNKFEKVRKKKYGTMFYDHLYNCCPIPCL